MPEMFRGGTCYVPPSQTPVKVKINYPKKEREKIWIPPIFLKKNKYTNSLSASSALSETPNHYRGLSFYGLFYSWSIIFLILSFLCWQGCWCHPQKVPGALKVCFSPVHPFSRVRFPHLKINIFVVEIWQLPIDHTTFSSGIRTYDTRNHSAESVALAWGEVRGVENKKAPGLGLFVESMPCY